jgi:hypothetical protein
MRIVKAKSEGVAILEATFPYTQIDPMRAKGRPPILTLGSACDRMRLNVSPAASNEWVADSPRSWDWGDSIS